MDELVRKESICILNSLKKGGILSSNHIEKLNEANKSIQKGLKDFVQWILRNDDKWNGIKRVRCINWVGIEGQFLSLFLEVSKVKNGVACFSFHSAELGRYNPSKQPAKKKIKLDLHPELEELNELLFDYDKEINFYKQMNKQLNDKMKRMQKEIDLYKIQRMKTIKNKYNNKKKDDIEEEEDFDLDKSTKQIRQHLSKYTV